MTCFIVIAIFMNRIVKEIVMKKFSKKENSLFPILHHTVNELQNWEL